MPLETEINAYEQMRDELQRLYTGKFIVIHGNEFIEAFDDLDSAAKEAIRQFGVGPAAVEQSVASTILANAHQFFLLRLQC